jgi:hypothetical protein
MRYVITNERTGEVVSGNAVLAANPLTRMKGLLGRSSMPSSEAIILRPASSIHTLFMRFGLDIIYVDRENQILKVVRDLAPFRFSSARGAMSVIEMAAGATGGHDLRAGDRLLFSGVDS